MNQCKRVSDCPADRLAQCRGQAVQARCDALQGLLNTADQRIDDLTHPAPVPPAMGVRAVVEPVAQCSEVDRQCSEQLRTQGRPVVLPGRRKLGHMCAGTAHRELQNGGWNACIDEFERLNK